MAGLCETALLEKAGCCGAAPDGSSATIINPPGQAALRYRLATFSTFRDRLLSGVPPRLPEWKDHGRRDYGIVLLEMWATLADILTFYQERIANEAFLRTAQLRESVVRIARLVDYRLNPGAAAGAYLAFTVDPGKKDEPPKRLELRQGLRCQTKPAPDAPPVPFETDEALTAHASLNQMRVQSLQDQSLGFGDIDAIVQGTATGLKPGDRILIVGQERFRDPASKQWELRRVTEVIPDKRAATTRVVWGEPLGHRMPRVEPSASPHLHALRTQAWPFGYNAPSYAALTA